MVLRGLWARLGYQGAAFVDMQLEITKELTNADFARFEREMLCNEIISLNQELELIKRERNDQIRRAETAQANLSQVIEAEERTFRALLSEREVAKRALERAEKGVQKVVVAKEKEAVRAEAMSEELQRLEKERIAAVLYAKTAEEKATIANITAKAATAVAVSAVQSHPPTPQSGFLTPRTPLLGERNSDRSGFTPRTPSLFDSTLDRGSPLTENWSMADEAILQSKIRERRLDAEESRLAAEATRLAQDRFKMKMERDRWSGMVS